MNELINLGNGQYVKVTMLKGEKGSNIATITKTATSGLTDTYTITLTDGSTTTFDVTNGSSIDHVTKTSTVGSVDTYTIYLTDGTVGGTFEVNNAVATIDQNFSATSTNPLMNKTLTNIIAGVENGSTASKTYNANDIILRNDSLYMVTTTVASGTAWADGVNISEKTIGELVGEVKSALTANSNMFYFDYQNGKYGYNTDPSRGAGTFSPFSGGGAKLIGTYTSTTNIDVSAYGATSASQFLAVAQSVSTSTASQYIEGVSSYGYKSASCSFSAPSLSLSGTTLRLTIGSVSGSGSVTNVTASASTNNRVKVYFVGDIS